MKKNEVTRPRWHQILVTAIIFCIIAGLAIYSINFFNYKSKISSIQLHEIAFSDIANGQYFGEYDSGYIYAKVQVNVENGTLQNIILLEHKNKRGKAAEQIVSTIVDTQTFPVDAISSATNSSMVIQKAVGNALEAGGINE